MLTWLGLMTGIIAPALVDRLERVRAAYREAGTLAAAFTQVYHDRLRVGGDLQRERGEFFVDRAGRVRLSYLEPERKEFVYDGTTAYFYQPEEAQVTVFASFEQSLVAASMQALWGHGELGALHHVGPCQKPAAGAPVPPALAIPAGELCVELVPKRPSPDVERVQVGLDEPGRRLRRFVVVDGMGNSTAYTFDKVRLGAPLDPALFRFEVPAGVTVLDARSAAPAPEPPAPPPAAPTP